MILIFCSLFSYNSTIPVIDDNVRNSGPRTAISIQDNRDDGLILNSNNNKNLTSKGII